jgi:hypothetical protein
MLIKRKRQAKTNDAELSEPWNAKWQFLPAISKLKRLTKTL